MKANEFVKKFGWDEAISLIDASKICGVDKSIVDIEELKRLVESYKIVNFYGGIQNAKTVSRMGKYYKYLKKAIADVELI